MCLRENSPLSASLCLSKSALAALICSVVGVVGWSIRGVCMCMRMHVHRHICGGREGCVHVMPTCGLSSAAFGFAASSARLLSSLMASRNSCSLSSPSLSRSSAHAAAGGAHGPHVRSGKAISTRTECDGLSDMRRRPNGLDVAAILLDRVLDLILGQLSVLVFVNCEAGDTCKSVSTASS